MSKVSFYLDDMQRVNAPTHVESSAPYDFAGTGNPATVALAWETTLLTNGTHVLSVDVQTTSGVKRADSTFTVQNTVTPPPSPPSGFTSHYTYTPIAPLPIGTTEAESVVVNDKLYLFGGFDVLQPVLNPTTRAWLYDPATNVWSSLPPVPANGIDHAGIDTDGTRYIYYAGGFRYDITGAALLQGTELVWRYDTLDGTYSPMPPLPVRRASGGLSYINGTLYYFGGSTDYQGTPDAGETFSLDVAGGATAWVQRATMPNPRNHIGWVTIDGKIYVAGGQYFEKSYFAQTELDRYDPATDTWTTLAPMPFARSHMLDSSMVIDGRFVVASGWTTTAQTAAVTAYDPVTNTWSSMTDLPLARTSATVRAISGGRFVYCCGSAGISTSSGWMGTPAP
jgi:N-acetylneuraminic acid mutarotase